MTSVSCPECKGMTNLPKADEPEACLNCGVMLAITEEGELEAVEVEEEGEGIDRPAQLPREAEEAQPRRKKIIKKAGKKK